MTPEDLAALERYFTAMQSGGATTLANASQAKKILATLVADPVDPVEPDPFDPPPDPEPEVDPVEPAVPGEWPGPDNTGPSGDLAVMAPRTVRDGEVLENFDISGTVKFEGNAVIRNGIIRGGMYGLTHTRADVPGSALIEHVRLVGDGGSAGIAPYGAWTMRACDILGYRDGVKVNSHQTVEGCWIHNLLKTSGSHNDGIQSVGGEHVVIRGNNIEGPWQQSTSALILGAGTVGYLRDYTIEANRLSGGTFTVYIGGKDGNPTPARIVVRDNVWVRGSWKYGATSWRLGWPEGDPGHVWSGNTFDDSTPLNR